MSLPSFKRKHRLSNAHTLPTFSRTPSPLPMSTYGLTKRGARFLVLTVAVFFLFGLFHQKTGLLWRRLPPLYENYRQRELHLPHYKEYESRQDMKYFWAANHAHSSGWGNVMQDFVMMGLLAHITGRSFVFNDYVWNPDGSRYSLYNGKLIPSRIPLTALLGGVMVGGEMPYGDNTPRAVAPGFFEKVCPNPTVLKVEDLNDHFMRFDDAASATLVMETWANKIKSIEDPCVKIDKDDIPIFEFWIYGSKNRMLPIWSYLKDSPVATHWGWSPLIHDAYQRNRHLFRPTTPLSVLDQMLDSYPARDEDYTTPIPGLLALHIRRGDFENHCQHLANWSSDWNAFNTFPEFVDKFDRPTDGGWGETSEKNMKMYIERCYPSIEQIVDKVATVRAQSKDLNYLYIMTNGAVPWVAQLKKALADAGDWDRIGSSRDLKLTWEQKYVAQALDMFVAQRAQVLIGNGWSSLTSNVVMLRMASGMSPDTNRFW
ncbi:hypothetical protein BJ138DRAFT_1114221 [Hygrophoropsis aurantiaca]|uniref:Uncharacterized protein n=1 Tax=Hygrophoropsis aurantiaca TaxID=72124 RepID=A0ACB8AB07_9AGAM|nr:hypothetical protein BJ138DRAFT_1114221 [Hygrophoropsis aurantiaca]